MASGGVFNGWVNCTGDSTAYRQITGGTFKSWQYMTADASNKFWVGTSKENYNVGVYVDDNGYLVVGGPEITGPGDKFTASSANYGGWSSYLKYSSAATNGLYYTCVAEALADNKSGKVTVYTNQLDLTSSSFKGTINLPNNESTLTVTLAEGSIPAWNVGTECEGKIAVYADAISSGVVTRTYTLKDGYKVTLKDGSDVLDNVTYYLCDVATTLPTLTKTGYTFAGWYADEAFTGDAVTEIAVGSTGDKSYYAKWTPNTYTVTLNANEGTVAEGKDVTSYTYGEGAALPAAADMTKTGYTFAGWYDNEQISDDSVTEIPADATGNKSYYAKWTPNTYTVTLNTDGGTIAEGKDVTDYTYGEGAALPAAADMTKSGYTFAGWYEDAQFSGDAVAEISTTDTGNKTYYAKWDKIPPAPVYPSVDTPAFDPDEDVDVEDNTLNDAALAVGGAIENGDIKMEPAAGYTAEEITRLQNEGKLNLVIQKKLGYDTTEKSLIDAAIAKVGGSASQVDVVYIDVTPVLMTDDGIVVATITDTEKPLTITLDLSAEMQKAAKEGKFISVIRVHDGNVTFLDSKLNAEKTKITFTSSEFSTYAVVALDKDPSANTFDAGIAMYGAMAVLAATGSAAIIIGKKRNS